MDQPLDDVTVVELGHIVAGPYCSMLLADLGAEVIKIEHPDRGDLLRSSSREGQSMFNYVNRNKKSVTLDLKADAGHDLLLNLVGEADVVVENFSAGTAASLGVGYGDLVEVSPDLIYCSIKGFAAGPYEKRPALDPVAEALSGMMSTTGHPGNPPTRCGTSIADMVASFQGALAIVGAIRQRDQTGEGQHLSTPLFESALSVMGGQIAFSETFGESASKMGAGGQPQWAPYDVYQTGDGQWVFLGVTTENHWDVLCEGLAIGLDDDRFQTMAKRCANREALQAMLTEVFSEYSREGLLEAVDQNELPLAPVYETDDVAEDDHLHASGGLIDIQTAAGPDRSIQVPRAPSRSSAYDRQEPSDPPSLGEHTDRLLQSMGYDSEQIDELRMDGVI